MRDVRAVRVRPKTWSKADRLRARRMQRYLNSQLAKLPPPSEILLDVAMTGVHFTRVS